MSSKQLVIIFILFILLGCSPAQDPDIGKRFRVTSKKGLHLRSKPHIQSKTIQFLPYAAEITLEKKQKTNSNNKQFNWMFVNYKNTKGWLLDTLVQKSPEYICTECVGQWQVSQKNKIAVPQNRDDRIHANIEKEYRKSNSNYWQMIKIIEKQQLNKYKKIVTRKRDRLIIHLKNGRKLTFNNTSNGKQQTKFRTYFFRDYLPKISQIIIQVNLYLGSTILMINQTDGTSKSFDDFPAFCPQKTHFAVLSKSGIYHNDGVEIWRISNNRIKRVYKIKYKDRVFKNIIWLKQNLVAILCSKCYQQSQKRKYIYISNPASK